MDVLEALRPCRQPSAAADLTLELGFGLTRRTRTWQGAIGTQSWPCAATRVPVLAIFYVKDIPHLLPDLTY